jgi:hypothetical protein
MPVQTMHVSFQNIVRCLKSAAGKLTHLPKERRHVAVGNRLTQAEQDQTALEEEAAQEAIHARRVDSFGRDRYVQS